MHLAPHSLTLGLVRRLLLGLGYSNTYIRLSFACFLGKHCLRNRCGRRFCSPYITHGKLCTNFSWWSTLLNPPPIRPVFLSHMAGGQNLRQTELPVTPVISTIFFKFNLGPCWSPPLFTTRQKTEGPTLAKTFSTISNIFFIKLTLFKGYLLEVSAEASLWFLQVLDSRQQTCKKSVWICPV